MSLAQQPGPGHAPDVVTRLRWALAGTALALVVVLALWVATLLAMRRAALSPPAADRTRSVGADRMSRAPSLAPVGKSAPTGKQAAPFRQTAGHAPAASRARPRVEIVERRVVAPLVTPGARPLLLLRPLAGLPRPQRGLGGWGTLKPQTPLSLAPVLKPPPLVTPPPEDPAGDVEAPETPPEPIACPTARYPEDAAAEGVTGSVRLKVIVGRRGRVEDAVVVRSSGDARLDQAAEAAVRRWRYRPARRNGRAVTAVDYARIEFYRADTEPGRPE